MLRPVRTASHDLVSSRDAEVRHPVALAARLLFRRSILGSTLFPFPDGWKVFPKLTTLSTHQSRGPVGWKIFAASSRYVSRTCPLSQVWPRREHEEADPARQPMRSLRRGHAVARSLSLSSKAASKKSLNLPKTTFPMHPNPALTEPPLLRRLSREHYEWQACQHRSNHQPRTCRHMRVLLLPGDGARGGGAIRLARRSTLRQR